MSTIFFLAMRRMRAPLLVLIFTYSVAVLGMVLIPGVDADGNPWRMSFFHAFYFVSFMASTIGFGEIPHAFSDGQRMWVTFSMYAAVVAWLYSIGSLLALVQDPAFRQALTARRFIRLVRGLRNPFYLICGYGDTGSELVEALSDRNQRAVVVEVKAERVNILNMQNLRQYVPALCGDARRPVHLLEAGLKHPLCKAVVALTNVNETNLKIAIAAKLLHPEVTVICRADSHDIGANMASFGTDHIIDPFDTFAAHLSAALRFPCLYQLRTWLTGAGHGERVESVCPPRQGVWLICGYGRFGKAINRHLKAEGIETVIIEAEPEKTGTPDQGCVVGRGTEAVTLREGRIEQAAGLVAGTDDDANNLSIIMTARELNPRLFVVARQNLADNQAIIDAVQADMVMRPSAIIANKIRVLLAAPLLYKFIQLGQKQGEDWASGLIGRISAFVELGQPLDVWEVKLKEEDAQAVCKAMQVGRQVTLGEVQQGSRGQDHALPCIALLLARAGEVRLLPEADVPLSKGDCLLFCGRQGARSSMKWALQNDNALDYILTGEARPQGLVWRMFKGGTPKEGVSGTD